MDVKTTRALVEDVFRRFFCLNYLTDWGKLSLQSFLFLLFKNFNFPLFGRAVYEKCPRFRSLCP